MAFMISPNSQLASPAPRRKSQYRFKASRLAILAASVSFAAIASPAYAQCVEGPPNTYGCSGATDVPQVIVDDDATVAADFGFTVDTSGNGNGIALSVTGNGRISFEGGGSFTGAGVSLATTGSSGGSAGEILAFSNADIFANGAHGLYLDNGGGGDTTVSWLGTISNTGGDGIFARSDLGAGNLSLIVKDVIATDNGVFVVWSGDGSAVVTAVGPVIGQTGSGVFVSASPTADDVDITVGDVTGGSWGIQASNHGSGFVQVDATGTVTGQGLVGISASGGTNTTGVRVLANVVNGQTLGIATANDGVGDTVIVATGAVTGATSFGIAANNNVTAGNLSITATDVTGAWGISGRNDGIGSTRIVATGNVVGFAEDAILANSDVNAIDLLVDVHNAEGAQNGVRVRNYGSGVTIVRSNGIVTGQGMNGIRAETGTGGQGMLVDVNEVIGGNNGILVLNQGAGPVRVSATGRVIGTTGSGIAVDNGPGGTDIRVDAATVSGGLIGIRATNGGSGESFIATTGLVSGSIFGVLAQNDVNATDLTVRAADVQSQGDAILAENFGSGETSIIATGNVIAQNQVGIRVFADANADDITVEAANASGGFSGIAVTNLGLGDTRVTVNGTVQGGDNAINVVSNNGQSVVIINNGIVSNASGLSLDRAISATGSVGIGNASSLIGTLDISGTNSLMLNAGIWRSIGGTSIFGTADDQLFNSATGTIVGATAAATAETTVWQGLERFQNAGVLRLQDGGTGDLIQTSAATIFADGSGLTVDIGGATGSDTFRTTGTVQIETGSRLQSVTGQPLVLHGKHVVVQADGGLTGQFIFADQFLTAFAGLRDGYSATTAFIEFAQLRALADAGITPNQKETAGGADSLPDGNAVKDALLLLPNDAAAQNAFDQLSGEIHPSARGAMIEDSRLLRNAVLDRLADGDQGGAVWGRAFADTGLSDGDLNAAKVNRDTRGFMIGVDRAIGPVTIGVAGGWSDTDLRVARRDSKASVETIHGLLYAGGQFGRFNLRGGVGYARTSTETERRIAFQGFSATPRADYHGSVLQGFIEAGYRVPLGGGHVEPFAGLTALRARSDAFKEASGPAALSGKAISEDSYGSTLGLRFETSRAGALSLRGTMAWRHGWGDLTPAGRHALDGGTDFTVLGASGSRDAGIARIEAQYRLSSNVTLGVAYDGVLGTGGEDHAITGGLKIVF